jgi:hypothetical protein
MPKPMLISLIPPVTFGGGHSSVVANSFDYSGNFRQRNGSFKRPRMEGGAGASGDSYYDLSRDATVAAPPSGLKVDTAKIRELMVKANEAASTIRSQFCTDSAPEDVRELAGFSMNLLELLNAVVEGGILPMSAPPPRPSPPLLPRQLQTLLRTTNLG